MGLESGSGDARYHLYQMGAREPKLDSQQFELISKALADPKRFEMLQTIAASKEAPTCSCIREWLGLATHDCVAPSERVGERRSRKRPARR